MAMNAADDREEMPDVCVVTHPLAAAGENATRSLLDILGALTSVALVTANLPKDSEIWERWEVVELTSKGAGGSIPVAAVRFVLNQIRMCLVLSRRDEPVVLFYGATSYVLPIAVARLLGKRVLVEPRGDVPLTLRLNWERRVPAVVARGLAGAVRLLERAGFGLAHGVVTYTPSMAEQLGLDPDAPDVYPTGARYVRTDVFDIEIPYGERDMVVGFLGRLDEEKGIRELVEAVKLLPEDIEFRFVGDGPLREWVERELDSEVDGGRVTVTGWIDHDEVPGYLNEFRLAVLPSQPTEGLPTTILEAMACGTPVYASPVSGVPDVVREGETGFLMDDRNPEMICREIEAILAEIQLGALSNRCRSLIQSEYSFDTAIGRYEAILLDQT